MVDPWSYGLGFPKLDTLYLYSCHLVFNRVELDHFKMRKKVELDGLFGTFLFTFFLIFLLGLEIIQESS